jgi:hypothetical protein
LVWLPADCAQMLPWLAAARVACQRVTAPRAWTTSAQAWQRAFHAMGVQLGSWLLIPVCVISSAKVLYWPARLTCVRRRAYGLPRSPGK